MCCGVRHWMTTEQVNLYINLLIIALLKFIDYLGSRGDKFIHGALTEDFERSSFKRVPEKPPTAIFYDQAGEILREVLLEEMKRLEMFQLLDSWGIPRKVLIPPKEDL